MDRNTNQNANKFSSFTFAHKTPENLFNFLGKHNIQTKTYQHKPIFTVAEGREVEEFIPGCHTKNLFLVNKRKNVFMLITMIGKDRLDLKAFTKLMGFSSGSLSFASDEHLLHFLGVEPGHVTPFALLNDSSKEVKVILDQDMMEYEIINFHPLKNDKTTSISSKNFLKFLELVGHKPDIIALSKL